MERRGGLRMQGYLTLKPRRGSAPAPAAVVRPEPLQISVIVCAHNEEWFLPACLESLCRQTRLPDELIVVDNASTDRTAEVARAVPAATVVEQPRKGLVHARVTGWQVATGHLLAYLDADCRAPANWLARIEGIFRRAPHVVAVTGGYRFYDWDCLGRTLLRIYDWTAAPLTHVCLQHWLRIGAILYGGNFAVRRTALDAIGGFDASIDFHGEDTNLGRRLIAVGCVHLATDCFVHTSARRYKALGRIAVFRLYLRNFWSEILVHRPRDRKHEDVRS